MVSSPWKNKPKAEDVKESYNVALQDLLLIKLLKTKDSNGLANILRRQFNEELFSTTHRELVSWLIETFTKIKAVPEDEIVLERFPSLGSFLLSKEEPKANLSFIFDELVNKQIKVKVLQTLELAHQTTNKSSDGFTLLNEISSLHSKLVQSFRHAQSQVFSPVELVDKVIEEYEISETGNRKGVPIPFNFLHKSIGRWEPGQLTTFVAKTGIGKTWALILCAEAAIRGNPFIHSQVDDEDAWPTLKQKTNRHKALFVSLEMPAVDIFRRLVCVMAKISFNRARSGKLNNLERKLYMDFANKIKDPNTEEHKILSNLQIVGPGSATTPEQINLLAEDFKADIVFVDGFYYLNGPGEKRWEKIEANMQQMRLHTLISNRHYILASQFRREAKNASTSTTDALAFSASIAHDSNNLIFLAQDEANKLQRTVNMWSGKVRDGELGSAYKMQWDFFEMNFAQIGDAAEFSDSDED